MAKDKKAKTVPIKQEPPAGVYVTRRDNPDKVMAFQGDQFQAQLTPTGDIAIVELVPDVGNTNGGNPTQQVRRFIAEGTWSDVVVV